MLIPLVSAAAATLLLGGCGASTPPDASAGSAASRPAPTTSGPSTSAKPAKFMTVDQLAATLGCQAIPAAGKRADYRQASCTVDGAEIVLLDFDTAEGQRGWVDTATLYGGVYLVGDRWVLSGKSKEYMQTLQATLGGTIEARPVSGPTR